MIVYLFFYPPGSGVATPQVDGQSSSFSFNSPSSRSSGTGQGTAKEERSDASCVIGFADLHGDLQQAHAVLRASGASNDTHLWAAGACTLVQTGDLVDRGPDSVAVTKLFEDVRVEAAAAGGKVVTLLGNHEVMNLQV